MTPDSKHPDDLERRLLERLVRSKRKYAQTSKLASSLRAPEQDVERALDRLVEQGEVVRTSKGRAAAAQRLGLLTGRMHVGRRGRAVVVPDLPDAPVAIPASRVRPAMHGDRVLIEASPDRRGPRGLRSGRVLRVLERATRVVVGCFTREGGATLVPLDPRLGYRVEVREPDASLRVGDRVAAEILSYPTATSDLEVRVRETLGREGLLATEIRSVCAAMGIPEPFSCRAEREAAAFSEPCSGQAEGRRDLREEPTVTIDGADARDFDDAVSLRGREHGGWRLTVSIADVAHYVRPGSALDAEAFERGTSTYFPGRAVPMLPERLSGGLASLVPGRDRLAVSVFLELDRRGRVSSVEFARTVIRSDARLTYEQVEAVLSGGASGLAASLADMLKAMGACADALSRLRARRGALDLDLPEPEVVLGGDGRPADIRQRERLRAHRLIEEFMIAANEAVARRLQQAGVGFLYRIHERPDEDALERLVPRLRALGVRLERDGYGLEPVHLQRALTSAAAARSPRQVNLLVLRSMMQARYSPYPEGHFGLASSAYCHFTSPIRRYPDLVVHRALLGVLQDRTRGLPDARALEAVAEHCSRTERRSADAERDVERAAGVLVLQDHIGAVYAGVVSSVERFGYFVELDRPFVEGFVALARLDEYYEYVPEQMMLQSRTSDRSICIGDRVRVRVVAADLPARSVEFAPVEKR